MANHISLPSFAQSAEIPNSLDLMDTSECAALLHCSPATLRSDVCRRRWNVPTVRVGRSIRYNRPDVLRWLASQNTPMVG
jgi:hypothetical protein